MSGPNYKRAAEFYDAFTWHAIPRSELRVGDLYANHATIDEVVHGPKKVRAGGWGTTDVADGEVWFRCGDSLSSKADARSIVVIGRRA